jgi:hypothetical protein
MTDLAYILSDTLTSVTDYIVESVIAMPPKVDPHKYFRVYVLYSLRHQGNPLLYNGNLLVLSN